MTNKVQGLDIQPHNNLDGLQGGNSTERYHLTQAQHDSLTSGGSISTEVLLNYNQQSDIIRKSLNVSSVTILGTGHIRVNFTNALPDTNYVVIAKAAHGGIWGSDALAIVRTTTYVEIYTYYNNTAYDMGFIDLVIFDS